MLAQWDLRPRGGNDAVRFEGGMLAGVRVPFSPHLNCLIGIQGSGKSSILESPRYALDIPFGDKAQDRDYKEELLPYVLKSGGKIVVEATDRHGTRFEVTRIIGHPPDVYVGGKPQPGVAIRETIIRKPLYFGQKDLSGGGQGVRPGPRRKNWSARASSMSARESPAPGPRSKRPSTRSCPSMAMVRKSASPTTS
jgi:hypothetical protein